jgi:hypothetical protein
VGEANLEIAPVPVAQDLWTASPVHDPANAAILSAALPANPGSEASVRALPDGAAADRDCAATEFEVLAPPLLLPGRKS